MFGTVVEVANELHKLRTRRFIPRFYKDYVFKKHKRECINLIKDILSESLIDYDVIVDFLRFYTKSKSLIDIYEIDFPFTMNYGKDVVSITYASNMQKCRIRFNEIALDVTETRYIPDGENDDILNKEGIQESFVTQDVMTPTEFNDYKNGYCKIRLIMQIINYINLYMSLVYEYGVENNETNIHESGQ